MCVCTHTFFFSLFFHFNIFLLEVLLLSTFDDDAFHENAFTLLALMECPQDLVILYIYIYETYIS